ncbi:hypothetical protein ACET3Z_005460 [Daucus carota]
MNIDKFNPETGKALFRVKCNLEPNAFPAFSFLHAKSDSLMPKSVLMLEITRLCFGLIGLFCLAFLFLPVSRGSILLRLIDIPFEHAARYHVWLGHLTMVIFSLHGLFYVIAWTMKGTVIQEGIPRTDLWVGFWNNEQVQLISSLPFSHVHTQRHKYYNNKLHHNEIIPIAEPSRTWHGNRVQSHTFSEASKQCKPLRSTRIHLALRLLGHCRSIKRNMLITQNSSSYDFISKGRSWSTNHTFTGCCDKFSTTYQT